MQLLLFLRERHAGHPEHLSYEHDDLLVPSDGRAKAHEFRRHYEGKRTRWVEKVPVSLVCPEAGALVGILFEKAKKHERKSAKKAGIPKPQVRRLGCLQASS